MQRTRRRGGAKYKPGMTFKKQVRNALQLAKRKRQAQHIANSIKKKQSKMVNELSNLFSATALSKPKSPTKVHKKSRGITKKSHAKKAHATQSVVASSVNNIANLFSSMKVGPVRATSRAPRRVSTRNVLIANQHAQQVENRKKQTAETRRMTPYERASARLQSVMHVNKPKSSRK